MHKKLQILGLLLLSAVSLNAQKKKTSQLERPKLVVGIVVDQMRWDFLYRYYNKYESNGFKRLLNDGYALNNVQINYIPTVTALGHACVFTGSVPSIHGLAGNNWIDKNTGENIYCTTDTSVQPVGTTNEKIGSHSPKNLWSTTITDQLKLATNLQGKVVGVSLKDRAAILPAGHNPNGAYWYDDTSGSFVTSSYYMNDLPQWVKKFNAKDLPKNLLKNGWNTLLPINQYTESSPDNVSWEKLIGSATTPTFPYNHLAKDYDKDNGVIRITPFGNTLTLEMAKASVEGEFLGKDAITDFLTINIASTDYVGHQFGPNSIEVEDTYLRLDQDLAAFFNYLDENVGKGEYTVMLSADHGCAHAHGFMKEHKMPTGIFGEGMDKKLNQKLKEKFGVDELLMSIYNYQVYLNQNKIEENQLDRESVINFAISELRKNPDILYAVELQEVGESAIPEPLKTKIINGYNWQRSGDIQLISHDSLLPYYSKKGTTHCVWNSYDSHIPLIFMGWGINHGESNVSYHMTDIAPTLSTLLKIEFPSGNIGIPIPEVLGK